MIPTLDQIHDYHARKLISIRPMDDLIICNYTPRCTYSQAWDDATMTCRGLILRLDRPWPDATQIEEVAALPFPKFFNLGEGGRYPTSELVDVTEKMDGSLGILYRHKGEYRIATRGAFDSKQALWATEYLNSRHFTLLHTIPDQWTLLFEIIYPGNRVVVDYGERKDLVLLGIRDRFTGEEVDDLVCIATSRGFSLPSRYSGGLAWWVEQSKTLDANFEGWVCRFADGSRFKIKGKGYLEVHKLLNGLSPKRVLDQMIAGTYEEWIESIPEEFTEEVRDWHCQLLETAETIEERVFAFFESAPKETRKEFAIWVQRVCPEFRVHMFLRFDGRDIMPYILDNMRPEEAIV